MPNYIVRYEIKMAASSIPIISRFSKCDVDYAVNARNKMAVSSNQVGLYIVIIIQ
jgi:hypothetical protein